jgi:prolyl 4-hydroxylase
MFYKHLTAILSQEKTQAILEQAKYLGFEKAKVNYYGQAQEKTEIRNNSRLEWDNEQLAQELEFILQTSMAQQFPYLFQNYVYAKIGAHFRVYQYEVGQYFKPHRDGSFQDKQLNSEITVLFYLNDCDGGETILMPYGPRYTEDYIHITPKAGDCLIFEHKMWHEGKTVHSGQKYVLRTDLFYK